MSQQPICALLDDYQNVALKSADWSVLENKVQIKRFDTYLGDEAAVVEAVSDCQIIVAMRERTPFPKSVLERLPNLKLMITTGMRNNSIDIGAANAAGITVCGTGAVGQPAAELAWGGLLAFMRQIPQEVANFRAGGPWQTGIGRTLSGRRLGIVGLGKLGRRMASFGQAFEMEVCGWNRTDPEARAAELGIASVPLDDLFATSDVIMIQLGLNAATQGFVTREMLHRMKPDAVLVNTARGPLVDEAALVEVLEQGRIGGAVLDVFGTEPLPADHPFRSLPNVLATPHLGYVTEENYRAYYTGAVEDILAWLDGTPKRVLS